MVNTFKDLVVWQRAFDLCLDVYRTTQDYPRQELYGLTTETRKTARQIVYSIAEGHKRDTTPDFLRFLNYSRASSDELETQLMLGDALNYLEPPDARRLRTKRTDVDRLLLRLTQSLRRKLP